MPKISHVVENRSLEQKGPIMAAKKPAGFSKLKKNHAGHIDARDILSPTTDPFLAMIIWHCVVLGAYVAVSTNRAKSSIKLYVKLGDEELTQWFNTPEEALSGLAEVNDCLVEMCLERGLTTKPADA